MITDAGPFTPFNAERSASPIPLTLSLPHRRVMPRWALHAAPRGASRRTEVLT
jgi:hypothetical protein